MTIFQLSPQEIIETLEVLNTAIENHRKWFDRLHKCMIFGYDFPVDVADCVAHTKCQFGQWYYGSLVDDSIKSLDEYILLDVAHRRMHDFARIIAADFADKKSSSEENYNNFLSYQREVMRLLNVLHDSLVEHQHGYDALTGLGNRGFITQFLEHAYENAQRYGYRYSVAMLDADHFKKVNDTFGHIGGDKVLKMIATQLRSSLRKSDCIGRYGGEEFLVILPETDESVAGKVMDSFRQTMQQQEIHFVDDVIRVTLSVGISAMHEDDDDPWQAVKRADFALYRAKDNGRNQVVSSNEMLSGKN